MVNKLIVTNYVNESLEIDTRNPESSGFLVYSIQGLGPEKADIQLTDITTNDGGIYNSSRIGTRNINLQLIYFPSYGQTIEELRLKSYRFFPVKTKVMLEFYTDNRTAKIEGYIESNSVNIYTSMEGSTISIICPNPFFESTDEQSKISAMFYGVEPKMRFIFPTNSEDPPKLVMGSYKTVSEKAITYTGDTENGLTIIIRASGAASGIIISNSVTHESIQIDDTKIPEGIKAGDEITITTTRGSKKITMLRSGETINILNSLDKNVTWLQVRKGDNVFSFTARTGVNNLEVSISAIVLYEGL